MKYIFVLLISAFCFANAAEAQIQILKISRQFYDDAVKLVSKIPGSKELMEKYGDDAFHIIKNSGDDGVKLIGKYGDDAIRLSKEFGDDGIKLLNKYGDDAIGFSTKYGKDGLTTLSLYGDDALKIAGKYGDDGIRLLKRNSTFSKALIRYNPPSGTWKTLVTFTDEGIKKTGILVEKMGNASQKYFDDFFNFIEKFGEKGCNFIWKSIDEVAKLVENHPTAVLIGATIAFAHQNPDVVNKIMEEGVNVTGEVARQIVKEIANTAGTTVEKTVETVSDSYILKMTVAGLLSIFTIGLMFKLGLIPLKEIFSRSGKKADNSNEKGEPPWV